MQVARGLGSLFSPLLLTGLKMEVKRLQTNDQLLLQDLRTQAVQTLDSEFNIMEVVVSSLEVIHLSFILSYYSQSFAPLLSACMHERCYVLIKIAVGAMAQF